MIFFLNFNRLFFLNIILYFPKNIRFSGEKNFIKNIYIFWFFCERTVKKKKKTKTDPKSGLGLLRDPGLFKRYLSGSRALETLKRIQKDVKKANKKNPTTLKISKISKKYQKVK